MEIGNNSKPTQYREITPQSIAVLKAKVTLKVTLLLLITIIIGF